MAIINVTELDLASWLRKARRAPDPIAYLTQLNDAATDAIAAGDEYVTATSFEGQSNTAERNVNARFLQHVTELCLQRLEAEEANDTTLTMPGGTDFSQGYSRV